MARKASTAWAKSQTEDFKSVAKRLGCDDDKATFGWKLGKIANPPKKRGPYKKAAV